MEIVNQGCLILSTALPAVKSDFFEPAFHMNQQEPQQDFTIGFNRNSETQNLSTDIPVEDIPVENIPVEDIPVENIPVEEADILKAELDILAADVPYTLRSSTVQDPLDNLQISNQSSQRQNPGSFATLPSQRQNPGSFATLPRLRNRSSGRDRSNATRSLFVETEEILIKPSISQRRNPGSFATLPSQRQNPGSLQTLPRWGQDRRSWSRSSSFHQTANNFTNQSKQSMTKISEIPRCLSNISDFKLPFEFGSKKSQSPEFQIYFAEKVTEVTFGHNIDAFVLWFTTSIKDSSKEEFANRIVAFYPQGDSPTFYAVKNRRFSSLIPGRKKNSYFKLGDRDDNVQKFCGEVLRKFFVKCFLEQCKFGTNSIIKEGLKRNFDSVEYWKDGMHKEVCATEEQISKLAEKLPRVFSVSSFLVVDKKRALLVLQDQDQNKWSFDIIKLKKLAGKNKILFKEFQNQPGSGSRIEQRWLQAKAGSLEDFDSLNPQLPSDLDLLPSDLDLGQGPSVTSEMCTIHIPKNPAPSRPVSNYDGAQGYAGTFLLSNARTDSTKSPSQPKNPGRSFSGLFLCEVVGVSAVLIASTLLFKTNSAKPRARSHLGSKGKSSPKVLKVGG